MGLNSRQMYQQAHKKVLNNARTEGIAERFVLEKDFDSRSVTFDKFKEYALNQYDNMVKPEGSAALAFLNDPDYNSSFAGILIDKSNDKKEQKEKKRNLLAKKKKRNMLAKRPQVIVFYMVTVATVLMPTQNAGRCLKMVKFFLDIA